MSDHPSLDALDYIARMLKTLFVCFLLGLLFNLVWNILVFCGLRFVGFRYLGANLRDGFIGFLAFAGFVLPYGFGAGYHPGIGVLAALILWPTTIWCLRMETQIYIQRRLNYVNYLLALRAQGTT